MNLIYFRCNNIGVVGSKKLIDAISNLKCLYYLDLNLKLIFILFYFSYNKIGENGAIQLSYGISNLYLLD